MKLVIGSRVLSMVKVFLLIPLLWLVSACAGTGSTPTSPLNATEQLIDHAGIIAGNDKFITRLHESRTWVPFRALSADPVEIGKTVEIPIKNAHVKLIGPSRDDALRSLAIKLWMIENAHHTLDVVYYIFSPDLVGQAVLGALCNAVQRGVDVRIMVDSIGSIGLPRSNLRALETCADDAGYMLNADGQATPNKARVQVTIFNALTSTISWINRRSHDKLLVSDGAFPDDAMVLTGGRNISLAYYGVNDDGTEDPGSYRDLEILLQPGPGDNYDNPTVGNISEIYYSLLFLHKGNKRLRPVYPIYPHNSDTSATERYRKYRQKAQQSLAKLKRFSGIAQRLGDMPRYMDTGFRQSEVVLAHELGNLTNRNVVTRTEQNLAGNPNSIMSVLNQFGHDAAHNDTSLKVVSPYLFMSRYVDKNGDVVSDSVVEIHQWLREDPDNRFEIITNSVLTSDNVLAQSVIDMELGPRLLLTPELKAAWLSSNLEKGELNPLVVKSEEWGKQVANPQIYIYQTGKLDAAILGNGDQQYGKLHAKYLMGDEISFVGTSNFDYRSRLYNNEMGFFNSSKQVREDLNGIFNELKKTSTRWGTPEWLQLRREVMKTHGLKAWGTRKQRFIYKFLRATGLIWLI